MIIGGSYLLDLVTSSVKKSSSHRTFLGLSAAIGAGSGMIAHYASPLLPTGMLIPCGMAVGKIIYESSFLLMRMRQSIVVRESASLHDSLMNNSRTIYFDSLICGQKSDGGKDNEIVVPKKTTALIVKRRMDDSDEIPFEPLNCSTIEEAQKEMGDISSSPQSIVVLRTPHDQNVKLVRLSKNKNGIEKL